jgi:tRNA(Ile)-lysidine synthase
MQCEGFGCWACAIASGPKTGASITNTKNLAIQRSPTMRVKHSSSSPAFASLGTANSRFPFDRQRPSLRTERWELRSCPLLYHFSVHDLAERLVKAIRKQESIRPGDRLAVAVSGGADSVALLCLLVELKTELGIVLSVAHVNHKLRGTESDDDEAFVTKLANDHQLEVHACDGPVDGNNPGIEAAARELRYRFFRRLAREGRVSTIATAHTLDDQAETVLLRIFRGTGIRGLSGIHPKITFEERGQVFGEVVRPLLGFRRAALLEYLRERGQSWREDSSNQGAAFLRNRLRNRLMPAIAEEFGDAAIEHLGALSEIARAEEDHWQRGHPEIAAQSPSAGQTPPGSLQIGPLLALPLAAQRRVLRAWLEAYAPDVTICFQRIEDALELARGGAGRQLELTCGWSLQHTRQHLLLEMDPVRDSEGADYQYTLPLPGLVKIPELGVCIEARIVDAPGFSEGVPGGAPEKERRQLLDPARLRKEVLIRNWRPGDRFWPAHTAAAKKVKELLTARHVTGTQKKLWPVAVAEGCGIVWMRGFSAPAAFSAAAAAQAIWIREIAGIM